MDYIFIFIILIATLMSIKFDEYIHYIVASLVVILHVIYYKQSDIEHFINAEAIQNLANLVNSYKFNVTNLRVTGDFFGGSIDVKGNMNANGNETNEFYQLESPMFINTIREASGVPPRW